MVSTPDENFLLIRGSLYLAGVGRSSDSESVRMAVYDLHDGRFLGYKSDTFWSLNPTRFKEHVSDDRVGLEGRLVQNLISYLNEYKLSANVSWRIDVEHLRNCGEPLYQHVVRKSSEGKYIAESYDATVHGSFQK